jgi:hypothetical protein
MRGAAGCQTGSWEGGADSAGGRDPLATVRNLLHAWAAVAATEEGIQCPLVHPALRSGGGGGSPRPIACPLRPTLEHELACALEEARRRGGLTARDDGVALARFLLAIMQGLSVVGRLHPDPDHLCTLADEALAALGVAAPEPG